MLKIVLTVMAWSCCLAGWCQYTVSGTISIESTSERLPGATIQLDRGNYNTISNEEGYFEIRGVKSGAYKMKVRFLGYVEESRELNVSNNLSLEIVMHENVNLTDEVVILATRAYEKSPTTYSNLSQAEIKHQNFGQDLPFILNWTPSLVTTSDAGAGVGYTGLRIRGSDATRINVTINGIPYNDSESQGVFWVDVPDIATSTKSIQVQRGVGTSTNGAGAFGASINLQTNGKNPEPYADLINSFGSFNTHRHTIGFGTGMINQFSFDARASLIQSDGFIDRASSDLKSYYVSGGYYGKKTIVRAIAFGGKERTYQSWYGVPESRLNNDVSAMLATASAEGWNAQQTNNLLTSNNRTFNLYDYKDQVDDYAQDNFQLHTSHQFSQRLTANVSLHYTKGKGFYEEFKFDQALANYGVADASVGTETITNVDLVRRRWLDNDFYGITYSLNYNSDIYSTVIGGAWNSYSGDHFGEITWAGVALTIPKDYRYYFNQGDKKDFNLFWKSNWQVNQKLNGYLDLQLRTVHYLAQGFDNDQIDFNVSSNYNFFNPKVGFTYEVNKGRQLYASYSVGQREPVREDFINASTGKAPKAEVLNNVEIGWRVNSTRHFLNVNYYLMNYKDQLVLTGQINDVGAPIRTNVDKSYRSGIEMEGGIQLHKKLNWGANVTVSENKIKNFTEVIYDYGVNFDEFNEIQNQLKDVDISFSPSLIIGSNLAYSPHRKFEAVLLSKYVGNQFLDNTSNAARRISAYLVNDLRFNYHPHIQGLKEFGVSLLVNNLLDSKYESNGYTYGYIGGGETVRQNYYYPQAGRNYFLMLSMKF